MSFRQSGAANAATQGPLARQLERVLHVTSPRRSEPALPDMNVLIRQWVAQCKDSDYNHTEHGRIEEWNTTGVTDMSGLFRNHERFNKNIAKWNTSDVTDMSNMFAGALRFDQDISGWDVRKVENMQSMFRDAMLFNQDLHEWTVSSLMNTSMMFMGTGLFNGRLFSPTATLKNASSMFYMAKDFDLGFDAFCNELRRLHDDKLDEKVDTSGWLGWSGWYVNRLRIMHNRPHWFYWFDEDMHRHLPSVENVIQRYEEWFEWHVDPDIRARMSGIWDEH